MTTQADTIPAPPPKTLDQHQTALAMLEIVFNENRTMRESLRELEAVKEGSEDEQAA